MNITDLNGCPIEITDLEKAIQVCDSYRNYQHRDSSYTDFDKRRKAYWSDMHEKLTTLKKAVSNT